MKTIERAALNAGKSKLSEKAAWSEAQAEKLRKILPPGSTVYTVVKHVARSGMMRHIAAIAVVKGGAVNVSHAVSEVLGWTWMDDGSVKVTGAGMDMTFHLTYSLAQKLYGDGYKLNNQYL